jgi:hypothetical protein
MISCCIHSTFSTHAAVLLASESALLVAVAAGCWVSAECCCKWNEILRTCSQQICAVDTAHYFQEIRLQQRFVVNIWEGLPGDLFLCPYLLQLRLSGACIYSFHPNNYRHYWMREHSQRSRLCGYRMNGWLCP